MFELQRLRLLARAAAIGAAALTVSAAAHAQTVGAAASVNIKRVSGEPDAAVLDTESAGISFSVAAPATAHVSFVLEIGLEREATHTIVSELNQLRLGETRYTNRMRTVSALVSMHAATDRRVRLSVLGGLTFVHFERTITLDPAAAILGTAVQPTRSTFIDRMGAATVGLDCDITASRHFVIVPAIRAHSFRLASNLGGFSVRPSIGAKWIF
jgi:3-keto-L-gulonate-6-phosphate decarboxylase